MPLAGGTRLGPYEILAPIGAGGMGEVYRARDTRLDRTVAVKVLQEHLSKDPARRERFEREARVVSGLNHPHICTLHDIGSQDTPSGPVDFLVMEYVEGQTLAERLTKGPLPIEQALRHALEITEALDRAHRQGVVHRDLKPGNIILTKTGAKLLDFGLAKLAAASGAVDGTAATMMPTTARDLTAEGMILGTLQYMAPEQLEGREADARTDLFAFGVVVYEMATGRKAFEGKSQASLISAIMGKDPLPIAQIAPMSPPALDRVVKRCLEKDPDERWQSARDLAHELRWIGEADSGAGAAARSGVATIPEAGARPAAARGGIAAWLGRAVIAIPAAAILAAAFSALGWWLHAPVPVRVLRSSVTLPPKTSLDGQNASLAFSPDSRVLAFSAAETDGKLKLWVRPLDSLQAQALAGTEGATYPFFSPDGRFIGFFADRKLKKVPASGGAVQTLCDALDGRGATWSQGGVIVFAPGPFGGLSQVSEAGGAPTPLTTAEAEGATHRVPHFLPDGKRVLFFSGSGADKNTYGIYSVDLATKKVVEVAHENSEGLYASQGFLVFVREGNLMAQPIDLDTLHLRGEAAPIAEKIRFNPNRWTGSYAVSPDGLLLYQGGGFIGKPQIALFGPDGRKLGTIGEPAPVVSLRLSPDGMKAAANISGAADLLEIWIYDLARGLGSRFTFGPDPAVYPVWSPDGGRIVYSNGGGSLYVKATDGTSEPKPLSTEKSNIRQPMTWTPDGRAVVFRTQTGTTGLDLLILPMDGDQKPRPFIATPSNEYTGDFSPDGHWFAYISDESGRQELYIVPYPGPGGKWQVSSNGAGDLFWLSDGHEIGYITPENKLFAVGLTVRGANLDLGAAHPLFEGVTLPDNFNMTRDGKRILGTIPVEGSLSPPLTAVTNWATELAGR